MSLFRSNTNTFDESSYWETRHARAKLMTRKSGLRTNMTFNRLKANSITTGILKYIDENENVTKYEVVTNVLNKVGTKHELRDIIVACSQI